MARGLGATIGRGLLAVIDAFLPPDVRAPRGDERERLRYRGFIRATLLIFVGMLVIIALTANARGSVLHPEPALWALYALIMLANLVLVRFSGRAFLVNVINNFLGLLMMAALLHTTGGVSSPYLPLFLGGIAVTSNFGGMRPIMTVMGCFILMVSGVYLAQVEGWGWTAPPPPDHRFRFGFLLTAAFLVLLGSVSAQLARTRGSTLLRRARDQAEAGRRAAEAARGEAERALADLREAQRHLILSEKMASLGGLVAGVAHEVNTPVGLAVTGASQLTIETDRVRALMAEGRLKRSDLQEYLDTVAELGRLIQANSGRAARLIQSFKEVAVDQSSGERRAFDLAAYVGEVVASLAPQLRRTGHRVAVEVGEGIVVDGYPGPFAQVLTNLVMNSVMHGYAEGQSGTFTVAARRVGDALVELIYRDDGRGIPKPLWNRVFDPFFTTRRGTGGSGLGLHLVYNIVTGPMGGRVEVGDAPGGGARFTLVFPVTAPRQEERREEAEEPAAVH
ncbi:MAG TPA: HAMP domain-containing sensor histidine kinase [Azospirillaceae bacterium]|nr:HAMP domain-containing sensor histidine kinase [Azospirillaceae bacterium]